MGKDSILSTLATIGKIIKYSTTDNYLYACVEPHRDYRVYVDTSAFNTLVALNPTSIDITGSDDMVYVKVKVKID
jgi:hypothetical protein